MYIFNLKLNPKKILIICLIIAIIITLILEFSAPKINNTQLKQTFDYELNEDNFTNILKETHNNIDAYIGKSIKASGFVFTLYDFKENNFVCGRNMKLDGEEKVVGFLCEYNGELEIIDGEWIEITGIITKGYYMGDMPVIKIDTIKKITAPPNTYVKAPDNL
jgi:uncharacterized membrane protein YcgQ (UPF0703/DUF1980 family)